MSFGPDASVDPIEHLVSLNWDHPLPSAVVALTLQPRVLTLITPKSAAESARALEAVLGRRGIEVDVQFGDEATDVDAGGVDTRMRAVISRVLNVCDGATLDYTGGSKLMAAIARLELEPGGDSRAVYLDQAGILRWDDGRTQRVSSMLDIVEIGALHGYEVLGAGGRALSSIGFRSDVLSDARNILACAQAGGRPLFWDDVVALGRVARGELKSGSAHPRKGKRTPLQNSDPSRAKSRTVGPACSRWASRRRATGLRSSSLIASRLRSLKLDLMARCGSVSRPGSGKEDQDTPACGVNTPLSGGS
jgi:hypothetical protein